MTIYGIIAGVSVALIAGAYLYGRNDADAHCEARISASKTAWFVEVTEQIRRGRAAGDAAERVRDNDPDPYRRD